MTKYKSSGKEKKQILSDDERKIEARRESNRAAAEQSLTVSKVLLSKKCKALL